MSGADEQRRTTILAEESRRGALTGYQESLRRRAKYAPDAQRRLKERVFDTFDALLRMRGFPGLKQGMSLVDLGAADHAFVKICVEHGLVAQGVDAAEGVDLEKDPLPFASDSVDVVTAISVIEHLWSPAVMLAEARRVLRPGGAFILVCPNWRYSWKEFYDDPTHVHPYTERSLARSLANAGFDDPVVFPWLVKKPAWLWTMPGAFFVARWLIPFRGDAPRVIPQFLRGKTRSLLAMCRKPVAQ